MTSPRSHFEMAKLDKLLTVNAKVLTKYWKVCVKYTSQKSILVDIEWQNSSHLRLATLMLWLSTTKCFWNTPPEYLKMYTKSVWVWNTLMSGSCSKSHKCNASNSSGQTKVWMVVLNVTKVRPPEQGTTLNYNWLSLKSIHENRLNSFRKVTVSNARYIPCCTECSWFARSRLLRVPGSLIRLQIDVS